MSNELSITNTSDEIEINTNNSDRLALFIKGIFGIAPYFGPIIAETVSSKIPNQKLDRAIRFIGILNDKIKYLDEDLVRQKMKTEEFSDLLEEALIQASKSPSDQRREYIAALLKNSISKDDLESIEKMKLLNLLNELNDAEIIFLKYYSLHTYSRSDYAEQHNELFTPIRQTIGAPQENFEKAALRTSYKNKLIETGVINPKFQKPKKGEAPDFDEKTGGLKSNSFEATTLGRLLLKYIDLKEIDQTAT